MMKTWESKKKQRRSTGAQRYTLMCVWETVFPMKKKASLKSPVCALLDICTLCGLHNQELNY